MIENLQELQELMSKAADAQRDAWMAGEGRFNVLIAGNTGAGKSTLVNAFFGTEDAKVDTGASVTDRLEEHRVPGKPIVIYDTRGFETGATEAVTICEKAIISLRKREREEERLHIAWLAVDQATGRFEKSHERFIAFLKSHKIPTVVVVTKSFNEAGSLEEKISIAVGPTVPVVNVLASDYRTRAGVIPAEGMDLLLKETLKLVPLGRRTAVAAAQVISWSTKDDVAAKVIRKYALLSGGTALSPVPGTQLVGLAVLQAKMMAELDAIAGAATSNAMHYAKLVALATARTGGLKLFQLGVAQVLKFIPTIGTVAGTALGVGVATSVTEALGRAYWVATKLSVTNGETVDKEEFSKIFEREKKVDSDSKDLSQ